MQNFIYQLKIDKLAKRASFQHGLNFELALEVSFATHVLSIFFVENSNLLLFIYRVPKFVFL